MVKFLALCQINRNTSIFVLLEHHLLVLHEDLKNLKFRNVEALLDGSGGGLLDQVHDAGHPRLEVGELGRHLSRRAAAQQEDVPDHVLQGHELQDHLNVPPDLAHHAPADPSPDESAALTHLHFLV